MIIGVIGGRDTDGRELYDNQSYVSRSIDLVLSMIQPHELPDLRFISGGSKGSETLAIKWAEEKGIPCSVIPPRIRTFAAEEDGINKAFRDRNNRIIANCNYVVFFWNGNVPVILEAITICANFKKPALVFPLM